MNIRNGYNVLSVLLIIIMISFLLIGCDVYKSKESKAYINEIKQLSDEFEDKSKLANNTSRMSLTPVISDMQDIKREVNNLNAPKNAKKLVELQGLVSEYMDSIIDGFMLFQSQESDSIVLGKFETAIINKQLVEDKLFEIENPKEYKKLNSETTETKKLDTSGKIAFFSRRDGGNEKTYVMNADGTGVTRLTNNEKTDWAPDWSPDGNKIVFTSARDVNDQIYAMNSDGSDQVRLTNNDADDKWPAWSPDGNKIAFTSSRDGNSEIYVMNSDGSNIVRLTNNFAEDLWPTWSPNNTRIAFESDRDGNSEIYVMNSDGSSQVRLTNSDAADSQPAWSPDGSKIAFISSIDNTQIYVMNPDGSSTIRLTNINDTNAGPAWSPDSSWIAFSSSSDSSHGIYVMSSDGSSITSITTDDDGHPAWH
jgi:dipeptidyl aminopeptidase/acylaminoacyl peptidase